MSAMSRHKTRPTLDELKKMPIGGLRAEIAQLCVDAAIADHAEVLADAEMLAMDPDPKPERIVELWNMLRGETKRMEDKELPITGFGETRGNQFGLRELSKPEQTCAQCGRAFSASDFEGLICPDCVSKLLNP